MGISPLAVDSGGEHPNPEAHYQPVQTSNGNWQYPNPRGYGQSPEDSASVATHTGSPDTREPGLVGSPADVSTEPTAGRRECATMPTTTSAGRWSASTTPSVHRER